MNQDHRMDHRQAWEAIPWVVNGSAGDADRRLVDAHVQVCADCRDELQFQARLHRGIAAGAAPPHDPDPSLQRLWARIDRVEGDADAMALPRSVRSAGAGWSRTRLLAAAVVVQAIGLVAMVGLLRERPATAPYQTLTSPAVAPADGAGRGTLRMVASPRLSIGALQALLERCDLQIVHSSGDGSILTLAPRPGSGAAVESALALLRADPGVALAEPIVAAGR